MTPLITARAAAAPRMIVRTLMAILLTVVSLLTLVFFVLTIDVRDRVQRAVVDNLETGQRVFAALEQRREQEIHAHVVTIAENPTLKAALDTYDLEGGASSGVVTQLMTTLQRELDKIGLVVGGDVVVVTDREHVTLASTGRQRALWPSGHRVVLPELPGGDLIVKLPGGWFRLVVVPLTIAGRPVGNLFRATSLDSAYAAGLAALSRAQIAIVHGGEIVASTLSVTTAGAFATQLARSAEEQGTATILSDAIAYQRLVAFSDGTAIYALNSTTEATAEAAGRAYRVLAAIGLLGLMLGSIASLWLARTLTRPIHELSSAVALLALSRLPGATLPPSRNSQELATLTDAFNALMESRDVAEANTQAAYVGAIAALAGALDARDPYTAGHSQRVSALAVLIGRELGLADEVIESLRIGALLHDIGKIGISDAILRKPGRLTSDEFAAIKQHPELGARIICPIAFLAPHLPVVAFHHERPDGRGYPHGLSGEAIPLAARIVHVADAFDAMTTVRAYRPALGVDEALSELCRHRGTDFDGEVVDALVRTRSVHGSGRALPAAAA